MKIETKQELLELLQMPFAQFQQEAVPAAARGLQEAFSGKLRVTAMLGYSNVCKNNCLYCGMRAGNCSVERYRVSPEDVIATVEKAKESGLNRIFLVAGEDPKYGFESLLTVVAALNKADMFITLACGEFSPVQYGELKAAGADEYVMKFEMSKEESFNRLNPSTSFKKRMAAIEAVQQSGLLLASGNIVDWPGQSEEELAEDILLTRKLNVSWAPIIPYMPAANTPLAALGKRGSLEKTLREIALLRLLLPKCNITAQQPGENLMKGLADEEGNLNAIRFGANILFCDLLPEAKARAFRVIDRRNVTSMAHVYKVAELSGMGLSL